MPESPVPGKFVIEEYRSLNYNYDNKERQELHEKAFNRILI
jgi:hypothetical protein